MRSIQCNVGHLDRIMRIVAGLGIISAGLLFQSWWGAAGLIPLLTGIFRWCPAYVPLRLSTIKK